MDALVQHLHAAGIYNPLETIASDDAIFGITVAGESAVSLWQKLRALTDRTAHYPVILGVRHEALREMAQRRTLDSAPISGTLAFAATITIPDWLRKHRDMEPDFFADLDEGPWTPEKTAPITEFVIPYSIATRRPHPAVLIALVPTTISADVPAYLRFGAWNDCPEAGVHVAFARYWHQRHGAEIVGISSDIVEMTIPRPPATKEDALDLAREQYAYCADIVDQGVETISNLAATLLNSPNWYFWWD